MSMKGLVVLAALPYIALGAQQRRASTDEFQLFGYGPGLGGPGLFYAEGKQSLLRLLVLSYLHICEGFAYIGDPNLSNSSDAATVICKLSLSRLSIFVLNKWLVTNSNSAFVGSPNTTNLSNSTSANWSNVMLFVPGPTATDHRVGFLDSGAISDSDIITDSFFFYGATTMVIGSDGTLETLWTGLPVGNTGIYALYWNDTSQGQLQLTIRNIEPSNPSGSAPN
jgi:hypothetical protein